MSESKNLNPENDIENLTYENPNFRKQYAKLSMNAMVHGSDDSKKSVHDIPDRSENQVQSEYVDYYEDDDDDELYDEDDEEESEVYDALIKQSENLNKNLNAKKSSNSIPLDYELPQGWERHEDELGPYFWHIPTGTIQRDRPFLDTIDKSMIRSDSLVFLDKSAINVDYNPADDSIDENPDAEKKAEENVEEDDDDDDENQQNKALITRKKVKANMRLTFPTDDEDDEEESEELARGLSFVVHSLGWLDVEESQINSQTGSLVIKRCIYELSTRSDNAARCWGPDETQSMILKMNNEKISLIEPNTSTVLSVQMIREIRLWAVDDQNNFAYVVKDRKKSNDSKKSNILTCHVFHCDEQENQQSAQRIAIFLKDVLVRIKQREVTTKNNNNLQNRPQDLELSIRMNPENYEFPTPIEEPRKTLPAYYMGFVSVAKPSGVDILNMAIDEVANSLKMSMTNEHINEIELMRPVWVHVSPSNIVVECKETAATLVECRVRYLSFLGISLDNVKRCGFIVQINEQEFITHCFETEPSAGALCKTIEAACKLRYQKCLDAHSNQKTIHDSQCSQNSSIKKNILKDSTLAFIKSPSPVTALKSSISGVFSKFMNKTTSTK